MTFNTNYKKENNAKIEYVKYKGVEMIIWKI